MKLTGTKTEIEYRERLISSQNKLFKDANFRRLLEVLKANNSDIKTAYIIRHTPDQSEDIFRVLVNGASVNLIELDRLDESIEPIFECMSVVEYKKGLSKQSMIQLAVALELANDHC
ncbi:hypothetical protein [Nitrincola sp. MINF-07-Sa-05]|uniref:hypothetical protein n=1 Tax=Nitrincola salilacus TaxID=3400273 RepID=UPI003917D0ED